MTRHWIRASGGTSQASWPNSGTIIDLQTADDITTLLRSGNYLYPQTCVDGVTLAGYTATTSSFSTATYSQAGSQSSPSPQGYSPVMAGSSSSVDVEVGLASAGTYRLWAGYASLSGSNTERAFIFEGSSAALTGGVSGLSNPVTVNGLTAWTTGESVGTGAFRIMSDLSVWEKNVASTQTCGASEPSSTGKVVNDVVSDGTVQWKYTGRKALAYINSATTNSPMTIATQNGGSAVAASVWDPVTDSPPVVATITGAYGRVGYCLVRPAAARFRFTGFEALPVTLEDLNVYDILGRSMTTGSPKLYCMQPVAGTYKNTLGKAVLYFSPNTGSSLLGAFTLTGTLSLYFSIVNDLPGGVIGLRQLLPIPDAMAGLSQTLGIVHTDAAATGSPHTTWIEGTNPLEVVSSQGRPYNDNTVWGSVRSEAWLRHKEILNEHAVTLWTSTVGAADPTWDTDVIVTNDADLRTEMTNAETYSASHGRATNHRIRLQNGTYNGTSGHFSASFGTGQLRIEPYPGHDPTFNSKFQTFNVAGIHLKNLKITADQAVQSSGWQFVLTDPGPTGIDGTGHFGRYVFETCRFGIGHVGGIADIDINTRANAILSGDIAQSLYVLGAEVDGGDSASLFGIYGFRSWYFDDVITARLIKDQFAFSGPPDPDSTTGIWADSNTYGRVRNTTSRCEPDDVAFTSEAHADAFQGRTVGGNASFWYPNNVEENNCEGAWNSSTPYGVTDRVTHNGFVWKRPTGSTGDSINEEPGVAVGKWQTGGAGWNTGAQCFSREQNRWYTVAGTTTAGGAIAGVTGATGPTGTGTGIVDGGVIWNFFAENDIAGTSYVSAEKFFMVSARTLSAKPGTRQWHIGSNSGHGSREIFVGVDIINAHVGDKGVEFDEGELYLEYALMAGPPALNASHFNTLLSTVQMNNTDSFAMLEHCIWKQEPTQPDAGPAPVWQEDCRVLNWNTTGAVGERPQDYLGGTFSAVACLYGSGAGTPGTTWGYAFTDSIALSKEAYDEGLIGQLYTVNGTAGIFSTPADDPDPDPGTGSPRTGGLSLSLSVSL